MKSRPLLAALALAALVALAAGCGGGSSGADPASVAPAGTPIFVEGELQPTGELKANTEAVVKRVAGIDDLGEFIVSKLEEEADDEGEPVDFTKEVEPWLGERAAAFFQQVEDGEPTDGGAIVETTDAAATQEFIDVQVKESKDPYRSASYDGVDFEVGGSEDSAIGVVDDFLVVGEDEEAFKDVVDASAGESLADEASFSKAIAAASDGSIADVFVDVGKLLDQSESQIDPQAREILQNAGIDPSEATAVASIVPGSKEVDVELSSDLAGEEAPTGDASELLGSLPADSFAGFAVSGFGEQLQQAVDSIDEEGISGAVPPHQLKKGLKEAGIDLESIVGSLQDAGLFAIGNSESSLGGALVVTTKGSQAASAIGNLGLLLRSAHVPGVTALGGKYSGFSVRSDELGPKPVVVAATDGRIAIGYGLPATLSALTSESESGSGRTLAETPAYEEAVGALGDTPISGFAEGRSALRLADALIPNSDEGFEEAKKYLKNVSFLALGSASQGDLATARLIVGLK